MRQHTAAAILQQIEYQLKTLLPSVIGIRHLILFVVGAEFTEQPKLGAEQCVAIIGPHIAQILLVHDKDKVVVAQIIFRHLPGTAAQIIAPVLRRCAHPLVRQFACMPAACASRADGDAISQSFGLDQGTHHPLGRRRAADVAQADKEEAKGSGHSFS